LPWSHWYQEPGAKTSALVGTTLPVKFLETDQKRNRIVVSHRRVLVQQRMAAYAPGQLVEGTVAAIKPFGVVVRLEDGLDGLLHVSQVSQLFVRELGSLFSVGETLRCMVIKVNPKDGSIGLSTKLLEAEPGDFIKAREPAVASGGASADEEA